MSDLLILVFKILPKGLISRIFGFCTRINLPAFMLNPVVKQYIKFFGIKESEIEYPENGFQNFDSFFTRNLKKGVIKIDSNKSSIVSPVDARIDQFGRINKTAIMQAKGISYSLTDLIPSDFAKEFADGSFITLYLSPADYHRIHSPVEGKVAGYFNIPGKLFSVHEVIVNKLEGLFSKNERLITYIRNDKGYVAVCKIGAMNVGRITTSYNDVTTNKAFRKKSEVFYQAAEQKVIKKGSELGMFHLGSTVILLFQKDKIKFAGFKLGDKVRVGQKIATYK